MVLIDIAEVLVFAIAAIGMVWVSWLRPIDYRDSRAVAISHSAEHLILQTGEDHSFYVRVQTGNGKNPTLYYTYWTNGAKYENTSHNAEVSAGTQPLTPRAAGYPWSKKDLKNWIRRPIKPTWQRSLLVTSQAFKRFRYACWQHC